MWGDLATLTKKRYQYKPISKTEEHDESGAILDFTMGQSGFEFTMDQPNVTTQEPGNIQEELPNNFEFAIDQLQPNESVVQEDNGYALVDGETPMKRMKMDETLDESEHISLIAAPEFEAEEVAPTTDSTLETLKAQFHGGEVELLKMIVRESKSRAAKLFFDVLVLKTRGIVGVRQDIAYGEIYVHDTGL